MILAWLVHSLLTALMVSGGAIALSAAAAWADLPRRWVWFASLWTVVGLPALAAFRPAGSAASAAPSGLMTVTTDLQLALMPASSSLALPLETIVRGGWAALSLGVFLALATAHRRLRREVGAGAVTVLDGVPVCVTDRLGPAVVGFARPRIVVPRWMTALPAAQQALVLAHERAHLRAGDQWLLALGLAAAVGMPWNPLVWWQLARLREAIETDCDRRVLRAGTPAAHYGRLLLDLADRAARRGTIVALSTPASFLSRRIVMLVPRPPRLRIARAFLAAAAGVTLFIIACESDAPLAAPAVPAASVTDQPPWVILDDGDTFRFRGGVALTTRPERLTGPVPRYPRLLRDAGIEGEVVLVFVIDEQGMVSGETIRVLESSNRAFERPAVEAIRASTFQPATQRGHAVPTLARMAVTFTLRDGGAARLTQTVTPAPEGVNARAMANPVPLRRQ